ncbi:hypothetical protein JCM8097_009247 [Rhodosporidiobolus ruineniae]
MPSQLLDTPIKPRDRHERSPGPSPFTPAPFRNSTSSRDPPPPNPFGTRTGSPLKQTINLPVRPLPSSHMVPLTLSPVVQSSSSAASTTDSQTLPNSPSSSSHTLSHAPQFASQAAAASTRKGPTEAELKAKARAALLKTRIRADPTLSSAFRDDPELLRLFVG